jgi:formylglycine-generating enzyme required for sulfatase activity
MDRTEVTNDEFAAFVEATGYITEAERPIGVQVLWHIKRPKVVRRGETQAAIASSAAAV